MSRRTTHVAIVISAGATLLLALAASHMRSTDTGRRFNFVVLGRQSFDAGEAGALLRAEAHAASDEELAVIAQRVAAEHPPDRLALLSAQLRSLRADARGGRLGVMISEAGALRYLSAPLLEIAGREYHSGRFVPRDFEKAMRYLDDPALRGEPSYAFFLGLVLVDERNPGGDATRGRQLIEQAAAGGFPRAVRWLAENG